MSTLRSLDATHSEVIAGRSLVQDGGIAAIDAMFPASSPQSHIGTVGLQTPSSGPWLTVLDAARHLGYACVNGRAPSTIYEIAQEIGHKVNRRDWRLHVDDLDTYVRRGGLSR